MEAQVGDTVVVGDVVGDISSRADKIETIIGPGLRLQIDKVIVCRSGILRTKGSNTYYVDSYHQKRYIPARGEAVVGVVTNKAGDIFKVDIGSSEQATLSYMAFEGATKKNRPDVQIGDILFAKVVLPSKDMEPELVCVDSYGKKGRLGVVPTGGFVFTCSLNLVRKILKRDCPLLKLLGRSIPHEIAIGMNGKVWVRASSVKETIAVGNAILEAEYLSNDDIKYLCEDVVNTLSMM